jgi:nitrogen PTS system EIIA component
LVEHHVANVIVVGSSPITRSIRLSRSGLVMIGCVGRVLSFYVNMSYRSKEDMNIFEILNEDAVTTDLKSRDKEGAISELAELLVSCGTVKRDEKASMVKKLKEREALGSTGIGKGVAIPHAKVPKIKKMQAAFGISKRGLDFKSLDGEPTYIFFLLVAPGETPGPHLKALAKISRMLDDKFVRDRLRSAKSNQDVVKIIKEEEQKRS